MRKLLFAVAALTVPLQVASAATSNVEFSATAIQTFPQSNKTMTGKLFASRAKMRQEVSQDGQPRVTITDVDQNVVWVLNPDRKEYVELKAPPPGAQGPSAPPAQAGPPPLPDEPGHMCQQQKEGLKCTKLGTETIGGRQTDKWEMVATQGEESVRIVMWIDRHLRLPIRGEFPGGVVSELRDIQEGPQPAALFTVPTDYKKVEMPQRSPQGQSGGPTPGQPGQPPR